MTAQCYSVTSLLLQPCRRHFVRAFEIALFPIRSLQTLKQFWFCFSKSFALQNLKDQTSTLVSFLVSVFCFSSHFKASFCAQKFPFFSIIVTLSLCQSPVNGRSRERDGNFKHKENYRSAGMLRIIVWQLQKYGETCRSHRQG